MAVAEDHADDDPYDQHGFGVRFDWGPMGLRRLAPVADVVVVVDVLSFTTCVSVAVERGAVVLPYRWNDGSEAQYAADHRAVVAAKAPTADGWWLSPSSLASLPAGTRLVLPSPNGSALCFAAVEAGAGRVLAGCLRNAAAVAGVVTGTVAVIAAGERWRGTTGPLRPGLEDHLGAGAVIAALDRDGDCSPEAGAAAALWRATHGAGRVAEVLGTCASGRELIGRGRSADVDLAAEVDATTRAPRLDGAAFVAA